MGAFACHILHVNSTNVIRYVFLNADFGSSHGQPIHLPGAYATQLLMQLRVQQLLCWCFPLTELSISTGDLALRVASSMFITGGYAPGLLPPTRAGSAGVSQITTTGRGSFSLSEPQRLRDKKYIYMYRLPPPPSEASVCNEYLT